MTAEDAGLKRNNIIIFQLGSHVLFVTQRRSKLDICSDMTKRNKKFFVQSQILKDEYLYCSSDRRDEFLHSERKLVGFFMKE